MDKISHAKIVKAIEEVASVNIRTAARDHYTVNCRRLYYKISMDTTPTTLKNIGTEVNRDHSTVVYGLKRAEELIEDPRYKQIYVNVLNKLGLKKEKINIFAEINDEDACIDYDTIKKIVEIIKPLSSDQLKELFEYRIKPFVRMNKLDTEHNR